MQNGHYRSLCTRPFPNPSGVILEIVGQAVTNVTQGCGFQVCHSRGVTHRGLVW